MRRLRLKAGLSQGQVAKIMGIRRERVSYWENGAFEPRDKTLERMATLFACKLSDFYDDPVLANDPTDAAA
jgi:transcriptional regulator with XRE-family HTH domain